MDKVDGGDMPENVFEDRVITETVPVHGSFTGMSIGTFQEDFQLCEADFLRLTNESTPLTSWAVNVFFASVGYAMSILPKWISEITGKSEAVTKSEWIVLIAGLLVSAVLFILSKFVANEKKELLGRMSTHFKSAPKTRLVRGQK
ncbi:hypothetical protein [Vogesella sp. XCS3]|uniref:hypothetical protein n=1 Tax=Vogesella sp. XCS3 TaxID=2877939 RepID=UPI001D0AEABF|nr:hypothetical protein [Vogesella sp. XCS3]UDM18428.1 hypothetical protein LCH97_07150 [Vogesella sp. XCS3]